MSRCVSDHYGGLWPVARFAEHGITVEQSARPKSQIYQDFLPLANAGRVELLDHKRLTAQFVGLERRTGRSDKDSIAEPPGSHDDCCNVVAGVLVGLDLDRRPGLVRQDDLLVAGESLPLPTKCDLVFAVLSVGADGMAAIIYGARSRSFGIPLIIVDFDVLPLQSALFPEIRKRLSELVGACGARMGSPGAFMPEALVRQAQQAGVPARGIPPEMEDAERLALGVAAKIANGDVKIAAPVVAKAASSPFGAALDFRAGDKADEPLRIAALQSVAMALEQRA